MEQHRKAVIAVLGAATVLAACALVSRQYSSQTAYLWQLAYASFGALYKSKRQPGVGAAALCKYDWAQSQDEVLVEVQLPAGTSASDVSVRLDDSRLLVLLERQCAISGSLGGRIVPEESSWSIGGRGGTRMLSITLSKAPASTAGVQEFAIWQSLLLEGSSEQQQQQQQKAVEDLPAVHKRSGVYLDQLDDEADVKASAADQISRL